MGGDFAEVLGRLTKEERIEKFMIKFLEDPTFEALCRAIAEENHEEVFRTIHTLKGVSRNLGFTKLYLVCDEMTEAVRGGLVLENPALFEAVKQAYYQTTEAIVQYKVSHGI